MRERGFTRRTSRVAWRDRVNVELLEIQSVGAHWDAVGCTSFSISAWVAALPPWLSSTAKVDSRDGRLRPHYWHCALSRQLRKTLDQPWFHPFAEARPNLPSPMRMHREGLMHVSRREVHDRDDIWFIKKDGSNLDEV